MTSDKVQTLRGLACCLLVLYHVIGASDSQGLRLHSGWLRELADAMVVVRMPIFACIAGAMYGLSTKRGWGLVTDKSTRLLLPMLTVGTLFACVQYIVPGSNYRIEDWRYLHIAPVAHYWFLQSIFLIVCALAVTEYLLPMNTRRAWFGYFAASIFLYLNHPGYPWFGVLGATYLLPFFLLGVGMTRLQWDPLQEQRKTGILLLVTGSCFFIAQLALGAAIDRFSTTVLVSSLLLSSGLWSLGWVHPLFARIGNYSFSIFLFHAFFTPAARMISHSLVPDAHLLAIAISVPVGVIVPIWLEIFVLRTPLLRLFFLGSQHPPQRFA